MPFCIGLIAAWRAVISSLFFSLSAGLLEGNEEEGPEGEEAVDEENMLNGLDRLKVLDDPDAADAAGALDAADALDAPDRIDPLDAPEIPNGADAPDIST
jgi:hypothetical protein